MTSAARNRSRARDRSATPSSDDIRRSSLIDLPAEVFNGLPLGIYVCEAGGFITRFNRAAAELWGRIPRPEDPAERFCGSHRLHHLGGGPLSRDETPMAQVLRTGVPVRDHAMVIERPDGSRIVVVSDVAPLTNADGAMTGAVSCFRGVAEHPRLEPSVHDTEPGFRSLVASLPVAVYVIGATARLQYFNDAAESLWGFRPQLGEAEWSASWRLYWPDGRRIPPGECPMAVAFREGRAVCGVEAVAERPDGSRAPFLAYSTPLRDGAGRLTGAVYALVDIGAYRRADEATQRLAAIVEGSDDAIVSKDVGGVITSWNKGAERLFGYTAEEIVGRSITILIPPDRQDEEPGIIERIRSGERVDHYETVRRRKDGGLIEISLTVSPIRDAGGKVVGASKIARDITERRRAQEQQMLLLREMNHRVKNLFALAGGVVTLSARTAGTPQELATAVRERLSALARAHALTMRDLDEDTAQPGRAATLADLIQTIVSPHDDLMQNDDRRVRLEGPDLLIGPQALTSVALLVHELATNAAKYGALSAPEGRVEVTWTAADNRLGLTWRESGGPRLAGPATYEGFGARLIRRTVTHSLAGDVSHEWNAEGLTVRLSARLDRLAF